MFKFKNVPDGYNETFIKILEEFKDFKKNNIEIIKKENKKIENYKIKNLRKEVKVELHTKNIIIIFKGLKFDVKYKIEKLFVNNQNFEQNMNKYIFLFFFENYYQINNSFSYPKIITIKNKNNLLYIENDYFCFFYDEKSGHFSKNSDLINYFYIIKKFENELLIRDEEKYFSDFKKNKKNIINFFINEKEENIFRLKYKDKAILYNLRNNAFSNFDDYFKPFNQDLTFIKNNIKELKINSKEKYVIYYKKNKNIKSLKYFTNEVIYLKNKKIDLLTSNKFIYKNKSYYGYIEGNKVFLYDENVNKIEINTTDIIEQNSSNFTFINGCEIAKITNNTCLTLKKINELNCGIHFYSFDEFDKKICFLNFKNNYNLIGIFLNCEFFIINKDFELIQAKNNKKIYKKLMNNYNELIKENRKNNLLLNL